MHRPPDPAAQPSSASRVAAIDALLDVVSGLAPEYDGGLSNHGPMTLHALDVLGAPIVRMVAWVRAYSETVGSGDPVDDRHRRYLAEVIRLQPLVTHDWRTTLASEVGVLADGPATGAFTA